MRSSFNKTGVGTIMGSKNLKAIAVKGTKPVKIADSKKFMRIASKIIRRIVADPELKYYRDFGSPYSSMPGFSYEEFIKRIAKKHYACTSCPVSCKHLIYMKDESNRVFSYRVSHLAALAWHNRLAGIENWNELVKCVEHENRYGIEASVAAGMLSYLVECYKNGILTEEEIGFIPKRGGRALRELIQLIVNREGIGNLTAEGLLRVSEKIEGSEMYAVHIKGVGREHLLESEVSTSTIGSLTNPRGGHGDLTVVPFHTGNTVGANSEMIKGFCDNLGHQKEVMTRVCNGVDGFNVGRLTKWVQDYATVHVSMGLCNRPIIMRHIDLRELSALYGAATGFDVSPSQLLIAGERVFNVLKAFNVMMGVTRRDDMPSRGANWSPKKPLVVNGKSYGTLNLILNQYYDERGWDIKRGIPKKEKLIALGLQYIAEDS